MGSSTVGLGSTYASFPRSLLDGGLWRRLNRSRLCEAQSLLPVLALMNRGGGGRYLGLNRWRLADMSGLPARSVSEGISALTRERLIDCLDTGRLDSIRYRLTPRVWRRGERARVFFPGSLVTSGLWGTLTPIERALLPVIAMSVSRPKWKHVFELQDDVSLKDLWPWLQIAKASAYDDEKFDPLADLPRFWGVTKAPSDPLRRTVWFSRGLASPREYEDKLERPAYPPRFAEFDLLYCSFLAGLRMEAGMVAFNRLAGRDTTVMRVLCFEGQSWVHLPDATWRPELWRTDAELPAEVMMSWCR